VNSSIRHTDLHCQNWHRLYTIHDERVCELLAKVKSYKWKDYQIWIHGAILEDRYTMDLDMTLIGPKKPELIKQYLYLLTRLGQVHNIKVDVKYLMQGKLYDHKDYLETGKEQHILYAHYRPKDFKDEYGVFHEGLWLRAFKYPIAKLFEEGRDIQSPLRIV